MLGKPTLISLGALIALAVSCSPQPEGSTLAIPDKPFPNSCFAIIDGLRIHFRVWVPEKRLNSAFVLLIHGFGGSTEDWRAQFEFFRTRGFLTIAVDLPSFGYSDRSIVPTSQNIRAGWLWKLLAQIEHQYTLAADTSWILGGYSLGSAVAASMASQQPGKTAALILASGPGDDPQHGKQLAQVAGVYLPAIWPFTSIAQDALQSNFARPEGLRATLTKILNREPTKDEMEAYMRPWLIQGTARAVALNAILGLRVDPRIAPLSIEKPLLFIWGTKDKVITLPACTNLDYYLSDIEIQKVRAEPIQRGASPFNLLEVSGGQFRLVDGAGHGMLLTHSAPVDRIIESFLLEKGLLAE